MTYRKGERVYVYVGVSKIKGTIVDITDIGKYEIELLDGSHVIKDVEDIYSETRI